MANAKSFKTVKIIMELSKEEAEFIKDISQNQLVDIEDKKTKSIRESIFETLKEALKES